MPVVSMPLFSRYQSAIQCCKYTFCACLRTSKASTSLKCLSCRCPLLCSLTFSPDLLRSRDSLGVSCTADCRKALLAGISAHLLSPRPAQSACMPQAESLKSFLPLYRCYGGPKACQTDAASCTGEIKVSHTQQNYCMRIEGLSCHRKGSQTQKALPGKLRLMKLVTEHKASPSSLAVRFLQDCYVFSFVGRQPLWHAP